MKNYKNIITLQRNERGIYDLDPSKGCTSGMANETGGCYQDCYAAKAASRYGIDFSTTVKRYFQNNRHKQRIVQAINRIDMPFVRMGCSGDPSEDWEHTISILEAIKRVNKEIVIITRHWNILTNEQLEKIKSFKVCINTSISALDKETVFDNCLKQYHRVKNFCKSVLRIVSCDFNLSNTEGLRLSKIQDRLFLNENILDTVFRPSKDSKWIGIINVKYGNFLSNKKTLISKFNRKTYLGKCSTCKEMCGVNIGEIVNRNPQNIFQLKLF